VESDLLKIAKTKRIFFMDSTVDIILKKASDFDLKYLLCITRVNDVAIDIFRESMYEYTSKLIRATDGRYDLDEYDKQVILIALGQFSEFQKEARSSA